MCVCARAVAPSSFLPLSPPIQVTVPWRRRDDPTKIGMLAVGPMLQPINNIVCPNMSSLSATCAVDLRASSGWLWNNATNSSDSIVVASSGCSQVDNDPYKAADGVLSFSGIEPRQGFATCKGKKKYTIHQKKVC